MHYNDKIGDAYSLIPLYHQSVYITMIKTIDILTARLFVRVQITLRFDPFFDWRCMLLLIAKERECKTIHIK
jgi:hypothetical protein